MTDAAVTPAAAPGQPAPVGGNLVNALSVLLAVLLGVALYFLYRRFVEGLGAVTNISNGYPWGIWVVWDVIIATGFACGGYAMALLVYIFNRGEFHPLVRPALTASAIGYSLGGASVLLDLGRYWNFWHILWPGYFNVNSVMFEVAACIALYVVVLWIEFSPIGLAYLKRTKLAGFTNRVLFFFIGLGVLLPSMHQSSLGSLLIPMGYQIHPLWQTPLLPLLFVTSALCMGYAVVIFETTLVGAGFGRDVSAELPLLGRVGKVIAWLLVAFLVLRFGDLAVRGQLAAIFTSGGRSVMFGVETLMFVAPVAMLWPEAPRARLSVLFPAASLMLGAAVLYRIDAFLVAYERGASWSYFPSVPELMVTIGVVALEVLAYLVFIRILPILPGHAR